MQGRHWRQVPGTMQECAMSSDASETSPEELVKRWNDLLKRFDRELLDAGLTDEQREQLLKELLDATHPPPPH